MPYVKVSIFSYLPNNRLSLAWLDHIPLLKIAVVFGNFLEIPCFIGVLASSGGFVLEDKHSAHIQ